MYGKTAIAVLYYFNFHLPHTQYPYYLFPSSPPSLALNVMLMLYSGLSALVPFSSRFILNILQLTPMKEMFCVDLD